MTLDDRSAKPEAVRELRPYRALLAECFELVAARLDAALVPALDDIDEELQARRDGGGAGEESKRLADVQVRLRVARDAIGARFRTAFEKHYEQRVRPAVRKRTIYEDSGLFFPELTLVDDEQISDSLAVRNLAGRLQSGSDAELHDLQMRIGFMLGREEVDADENPLGPTVICEALKDVLWSKEDPAELRAAMLELMIARLGEALTPIFHDVNALLVSRKVLPNVRARAKPSRAAQRADLRRRGGPDAEAEVVAAGIVQQLFSRGATPRSDWSAGPARAPLMQALTQLQRGETDVALGSDAFSLVQDAAGIANVINSLVEAGLPKHLGPVEGIVIDVVATLFDYIFDDDRVPDPIKGLIGRLQIPVLKLAILDHSFFSNRTHPARRLINALAQAGATWDGELTPDSSLLRTAEAIVLRIQNEFAEDAGVFAQCQEEFETYLVEQEREADARAAKLTERLKERERLELARELAQKAIAAKIGDTELPDVVREFVGTCWLKVLAQAALEGGEEGPRWRETVETLDELVWSVLPKQGADSRQKMVQRLPPLLRAVKVGMQTAGLDEAAQNGFFAQLVQLHAAALKAGMAQSDAAPARAQARRAAPPADSVDPTPESLELDLLSRGSWIELRDEAGPPRRVRLTWISPARTMYLFANRQGQRALALTRSELLRRFASGEAATADHEPLLDRVVDDVLDDFQR